MFSLNIRQLQYAIVLSQELSFSQAAEKLNISQPALSKHILNLENDLGVKLFERSTVPITLTPAGVHFIARAKELIYKEEQLLRSMESYKTGEAGELVIGITPFRSSYLVSRVLKKVRAKFPGIVVRLHEAGSDILRKEAAEGKYDFAIVNLPVDDSVLDVKPLESDRLVLALPKELESRVEGFSPANEIEFGACKNLPFVVVGETQEMRRLFDRLCVLADFTPNIAVEVVGLNTAWSIAQSGVAATILPWQFVSGEMSDNITVVGIKDVVYDRQPAIVTRRGQYITDAAQYAMVLLLNDK
ncbi:MAG: LysR family transcriptional regulator [Clostridia bacterium]|nr:LysR family transcriptional regulator [Clostridia bacterium]